MEQGESSTDMPATDAVQSIPPISEEEERARVAARIEEEERGKQSRGMLASR
jgi:hypothetical protein